MDDLGCFGWLRGVRIGSLNPAITEPTRIEIEGAGPLLPEDGDAFIVPSAWPGRYRVSLGLPEEDARVLQIVARLVARSAGHKKIILYAVPGREPFYKKFGFRRMLTAMAIFDTPELAKERGYIDDA